MSLTAGQTVGIGMLQGASNMFGASKQHKRNKELMGIQQGNQQQLNRQGHQLQMDMWNKTNYGAQVAHMEKAGLNPALMYGMGGGGGTTAGSQGGGSASGGGNPVQMHPMDMANIAKLKSEIDLNNAHTNKLGAETSLVNANIKNVDQDTLKKVQETSNLKTQQQLLEFEKSILKLKVDKKVTGSAFVDLLTQVGLDPVNNSADRAFLQGVLGGMGLLRAGGEIARIWGTIMSRGMNAGRGTGKNASKYMKKGLDGKGVTQAPKGLGYPN